MPPGVGLWMTKSSVGDDDPLPESLCSRDIGGILEGYWRDIGGTLVAAWIALLTISRQTIGPDSQGLI